MIAFTIIIAILFLVGLKSQDYRPFDKDKVVVLKPFLALGIVLSHLSSYSIYLHDFQRWGSLIVGIFFFISGYGLSYSLHYKVGYIRNCEGIAASVYGGVVILFCAERQLVRL